MDDLLTLLFEGLLRLVEPFGDSMTRRQLAIVIFAIISFVAVIAGVWFDGVVRLTFLVIAAVTFLLALVAWWRLIGE